MAAGPSYKNPTPEMVRLIERRNQAMFRQTGNAWDLTDPFPYDSEGRILKEDHFVMVNGVEVYDPDHRIPRKKGGR